jgi:hypothetical protein
MLAFVFLSAISGNSLCSMLVLLTNSVLLLGLPMLRTWWVKAWTYLHLEPFLLIAYMLLILDRIYYHHYYYAVVSCYNSDLHYYYYIIIILLL